ncbi:MAG: RDD family protein [Candidatus Levybacteria bacterium]|nr:RDD family protein [Candidatus Levybacteria bacterium]
MNYAGAGARFLAAIIDGLILLVINSIFGFVLGGNNQSPLSYLLSLGVSIGYWVFYQASQGQTIGKKVMRIKVVDASGNKPTVMTFFLREIIGKLVSAIILFIGYLMILWDAKKQGLHDKIAGTVVVRVTDVSAKSPVANTNNVAS